MLRFVAIASLIFDSSGCSGPGQAEPGELDAQVPSSVEEKDAPDATRAASLRAKLIGLAQEGFASASSAAPIPPVHTTMPQLRLSRPNRSADELARRLVGVLYAMELEIEEAHAFEWADTAMSAKGGADPSISEPSPGLVVVYDSELDDLMVVNTLLLDAHTRMATNVVPWKDARRAARALVDQGIVDPSLSLDLADVAFVRSGVEGPDGAHEEWVDEVLFEVNERVQGITLVDAGIRIGVTPTGGISSMRITEIEVEHVGAVTVGTTTEAIQGTFAEYLVSTALPFESVQISMRRLLYLLEPDVATAIVDPRYLIAYSIVVRDGDALSASRSTITLWSIVSPNPTLEARLPE